MERGVRVAWFCMGLCAGGLLVLIGVGIGTQAQNNDADRACKQNGFVSGAFDRDRGYLCARVLVPLGEPGK